VAELRPAVPGFSANRNIRLLYVATIVAGTLPFLPIWIIYLTDLRGLTLAQIGLMETFFWGVAIVMEVPTGAFSDRFGRRPTLLLGYGVQAIGVLVFALAGSFPLLLVSYALWSVGMAFGSGTIEAYLYEALAAEGREDEFPATMGRQTGFALLATTFGVIGGAALAGAISLRAPIFLAVATFVAAMPLVALMQEPPRARRATPLGYVQTITEGGRALRRSPAVAFMILLGISFALAGSAPMLLQQPFLQHHEVPIAAFGLFVGPVQLVGAAGALLAYRLPRLFGFARSMALLVAALVFALLLLGAVDHLGAFAGFAIARLAMHARLPLATDYINRRTPSDVRATVLSVRPLGAALVLAIVGPFVGFAAERSLQGAFLAAAIVTLLTASTSYLLWLRADRRSSASEASA
jgi:MFS family permease